MMTHTHCRLDNPTDADSIFAEEAEEGPIRIWYKRKILDLADVATLLDCLEIRGIRDRRLSTLYGGAFLVEWRE